jgi:hypothetical protein
VRLQQQQLWTTRLRTKSKLADHVRFLSNNVDAWESALRLLIDGAIAWSILIAAMVMQYNTPTLLDRYSQARSAR